MIVFDVEQIKRDILTGTEIPDNCNCDYAMDTGMTYCVNCIARAWKDEAGKVQAKLCDEQMGAKIEATRLRDALVEVASIAEADPDFSSHMLNILGSARAALARVQP